MTTTQREAYPFVTRVIGLFGGGLARCRKLNELMEYAAGSDELVRVARELNVAPAELELLVRRGSQRASELPEMLTALGIYETAVWRAERVLLRDMERVCSSCTHKRQCHQELADGTAATNYVEYCGNANTIDMLRFKS
jgi:hypothetical protein